MDTLRQWVVEWGAVGWVQALVIFAGTLLLAKLTQWIFRGVLSRAVQRTRSSLDDALVNDLQRPVFVSVVLGGLYLAMRPLGMPGDARELAGRLIWTLLVIIWLAAAIRLAHVILTSLAGRKSSSLVVDQRTLPLFDNSARVVLAGVAAYFVFVIWRIDLTAWLASAGIVGIAVGFAAKDTLGNLFAGIFILVDMPYKVGDFIVLDQGERGQVTHIGIRSTRLLTRDDVEIIIPNSVIGGAKIVNESGGPYKKARIRIQVGVAYGSDIDEVRALLMELAEKNPDVCADPAPRVRFRAFGESNLDFQLLCWIEDPALRGRVLDELNSAIYRGFEREGIEIPYPKRDLYLHHK